MTPARPVTTWSDEELRKAWDSANAASCVTATRQILAALGAVHPAEAREREREAWWGARTTYWPLIDGEVSAGAVGHRDAELDRRYPSLLPKSPPPLVLSGTTWIKAERTEPHLRGPWSWRDGNSGGVGYEQPIIKSASDAEKLAAWLRENGDDNERR